DEIIERMVRECESSAQPAGLSVARRALIVPTATRRQILDITAGIRDLVTSTQISDGIALVNVLHTTCGLLLQGGDPARLDNLTSLLERLVPDNARYKHNDPRYSDCERGNGVAHLRAALIGQSVAMAIRS